MSMKSLLAVMAVTAAMGWTTCRADVTAKISDVHLCCKGCVNGAEKAVGEVDGA